MWLLPYRKHAKLLGAVRCSPYVCEANNMPHSQTRPAARQARQHAPLLSSTAKMVGNPSSASSMALSTLALQATIISSSFHNVVAEDASATIENLSAGSRSQQKHLRRKRRRRLCETSKHGYHPVMGSKGCTNSPDYPESWEREGYIDRMFYEMAEGCCNFVFNDEGSYSCPVENVCNGTITYIGEAPPPPPPPSITPGTCVWHIDIDRQDGCTDDDK